MVLTVQPKRSSYLAARRRMVERQLAARGIRDWRVLHAMQDVPREQFTPALLGGVAHDDRPLPIGYEQTISQPYIVALMTESLELTGDERVLEVGTGSGYQTAVLAELCREVYSVERIKELHERAKGVLESLGFENIHLRIGDGSHGWQEAGPFDAIMVTAGATSLPPYYQDQLVEGGRLVIPIGPPADQVLHRYVREANQWRDEELSQVAFVPLVKG